MTDKETEKAIEILTNYEKTACDNCFLRPCGVRCELLNAVRFAIKYMQVELTEEQAIDKLHETGWMQRHDKEMTERPHGKWTTEQGTLLIKCSVCNQGYYYHPKNHFYHNFCPNCGADMRGEEC